MKNNHQSLAIMFFLGLFSETHIRFVGSIGISELLLFLSAPVVFMIDYRVLKRDGFMPVIVLAILSCIGCIISSLHNNTHPQLLYRGFASAYSLFAVPVVFHHFLRRNLNSLRWYIIGVSISAIITIFAFRNGVEAITFEKGGEVIGSGELFVVRHFGMLFSLALLAFYMQCPTLVSVGLFSLPFIYTILTTSSGRSGVLTMVMTLFMVIFVHRRWSRITRLKKHLLTLIVIGGSWAGILSMGYKYAAQEGMLNEKAQQKYEAQTKKGSGPLALLMSGRGEFFVGLMAAFDEPFWGHGPWPLDTKGYYRDFLRDYGDYDDYRRYEDYQNYLAMASGSFGYHALPVHSMIIGNWVFFGILGFPYWIYILLRIIYLLRRYIDAIPQWFGYLSFIIPSLLWNIFFSPFGARMSMGVSITAIMMAIAVGEKRILLPESMYWEAMKYDK